MAPLFSFLLSSVFYSLFSNATSLPFSFILLPLLFHSFSFSSFFLPSFFSLSFLSFFFLFSFSYLQMRACALWSGTNKNRDVSTRPLARLFARSLARLTHSLSPDCSLRSRPPLRSLVRSLAHFTHSLARGKENF